jgi:DNA-binding transcriptional LysR family regulator
MPPVTMEWEGRLGRRLRLRDLYILATVVKTGGMAKASRQLAMTQPSVSAAIANLEHLLGVRLLDRSPSGVVPTLYAEAMLRRSAVVFDELKQSVRDVETLANPSTGELRIAAAESINATMVPRFVEHFTDQYPQVLVHVQDIPPPGVMSTGLRNREFDVVVARRPPWTSDDRIPDDLNLEVLLDDPLIIAAGLDNPWARRRKIDLAELIEEPWILPPPGSWNHARLSEACQVRGVAMPTVRLSGYSMHLANHFVAHGPYLTAHPRSTAQFFSLKALPVKLPHRPWPVVIATLKHRTLSPVVQRFLESTREVAKTLATGRQRALA